MARDRIGAKVERVADAVADRIAEDEEDEARRQAPVRSGELRASIGRHPAVRSGTEVIGASARHAPFVEHSAHPSGRMRGTPFMSRAIALARQRARTHIKAVAQRAARRGGGS